MTLFYSYMCLSAANRRAWAETTDLNQALAVAFERLLVSPALMKSAEEFNKVHDYLRDYLFQCDPRHFPRYGAVGAPLDLIFNYLTTPNDHLLASVYTCESNRACGAPICITSKRSLPLVFVHSKKGEWCRRSGLPIQSHAMRLQDWVDIAISSRRMQVPQVLPCDEGCSSVRRPRTCLKNPPPLLFLELQPGTQAAPSRYLSIPGVTSVTTYTLRGIVYVGGYHFTSRIIDVQGTIWSYDGNSNRGVPYIHEDCKSADKALDLAALQEFQGRQAYFFTYGI